jgi:excisionase family DNA binding protein
LVQSGAIDAASVRWVTVRELAAMLGVSTSTVYQAVAAGELPHLRVSNAIRIPIATAAPLRVATVVNHREGTRRG